MKAQNFGTELDMTRLVNTVDVAERQSGQVTAVLAKTESLNSLQRIFSSGVELLVNLTNNTVFFATDNTDFDFEDCLNLLGEGKEFLGDPPFHIEVLLSLTLRCPSHGMGVRILPALLNRKRRRGSGIISDSEGKLRRSRGVSPAQTANAPQMESQFEGGRPSASTRDSQGAKQYSA